MPDSPKPRLAKAHAKSVADEYLRLGWTLRHEFRVPGVEEPAEYLFEWLADGDPISIDWQALRQRGANA